ncbi:mechanosensitive ion channel family protein [Desulfotomaculum copahuensis]|nr:mechanosensitive ion channel family protein [Desulfotomaculum copahuensis]
MHAAWQTFVTQLVQINWPDLAGKGIKIILFIVLAVVAMHLGDAAINRFFSTGEDRPGVMNSRRAQTMRTLLKSVLHYSVYFVVLVTVLSMFGVRVEAILAGAGVVGLAVGFGAQNLVRDIITGFFILLEDQFAVGDYITASGVSGTVEEIGLRITRLRDFGGELHIVPNGQIKQVTNHTRGSMQSQVDIRVAYEEDPDRIMALLQEVSRAVAADMAAVITEGPDVLGVVGLGAEGMTFRLVAKTRPMQQWSVEREIRRRAKETFDREGVKAPQLAVVGMTGRG